MSPNTASAWGSERVRGKGFPDHTPGTWVFWSSSSLVKQFFKRSSFKNFIREPLIKTWQMKKYGKIPPHPPRWCHLVLGAQSLSCVQFFCDPLDCSPPGSSVRGIFQARILEWAAISSSRGSSQPRDWTCVSCAPYVAGRFLMAEQWRKQSDPKSFLNHSILFHIEP